MRATLVAASAACSLAWPAQAVETSNFNLATTQDLIALCTGTPDDPLYAEALQFCYGYMAGVAQLHRVLVRADAIKPVACPHHEVTREELVQVFLGWAAQTRVPPRSFPPRTLSGPPPLRGRAAVTRTGDPMRLRAALFGAACLIGGCTGDGSTGAGSPRYVYDDWIYYQQSWYDDDFWVWVDDHPMLRRRRRPKRRPAGLVRRPRPRPAAGGARSGPDVDGREWGRACGRAVP